MASNTILKPVQFEGVGLHTGKLGRVRLEQGGPGSGINFRTPDGLIISATAANVVDTSRCTVLGTGEARISTVEHLLSACFALGVTDLDIQIEGPEIPIADGSAAVWAALLQDAGIRSVDDSANVSAVRLAAPIVLTAPNGSFIAAYPADSFRLTVAISFAHPLVGTQVARFESGRDDYSTEIAAARTFGFIEEVEALRAAGLAMGGSFDNAIVIYPDHYSSDLCYENELARHKLLDVIGDLALSGFSRLPFADIIAVKPSHRLNCELARRLLDQQTSVHCHEG